MSPVAMPLVAIKWNFWHLNAQGEASWFVLRGNRHALPFAAFHIAVEIGINFLQNTHYAPLTHKMISL